MGVCNSVNKENKEALKLKVIEKQESIKEEYFPMGRSIMINQHDIDE